VQSFQERIPQFRDAIGGFERYSFDLLFDQVPACSTFRGYQNYNKYRKGNITLRQALHNTGQRGVLLVVASSTRALEKMQRPLLSAEVG